MSAFDDLAGTTLAAVSGVLGKLEYISHLRKGAGKPYSHWGLSRVYGEAAAQEALAEAHRLLFLRILHTPLRELRNDTVVSSQATQLRPAEYVRSLRSRLSALVPPGLGGESVRQFSSVLLALSTLVSRRTKTLADTTDRV
jgi:hypothetical protein